MNGRDQFRGLGLNFPVILALKWGFEQVGVELLIGMNWFNIEFTCGHF
jgi:hypothetical protein